MALSKELKNFVKDFFDGKPETIEGLHISDRDGLELMGKMARRMENNASLIQWTNASAQGANGSSANTAVSSATAAQAEDSAELSLTDLNNKTYDDAAQDYTVDVTASGTSTNKQYSTDDGATWTAFTGATPFTLKDGKASWKVRADYTAGQTLVLTLSNASGGKSTDGTMTWTAA
jgi:hypothetical protein